MDKENLSPHIFTTARGFPMELETQLLLAKELKYFNEEKIFDKINDVAKLLNGLIQSRRKNLDFKNFLIYLSFIVYYLLLPTCYLLLPSQLTFAAFQNTSWSVSAESMGSVATAKNEEAFSIFYNPACLVNVENKEIQFAYYKPYSGLENVNFSISNFAFVLPTKYFSLGVGIGLYNVNSLYYESTTILSLSSVLKKIFSYLPNLSIGTNLKMLTKGYNFDNEILNYEPTLKDKNSVSSFSLDIGLNYKLLKNKLLLGLSVKDINRPNVAVTDTEDIVPMTISFGSAYNFGDIKAGLYFEDFTLATEIRYRDQIWGNLQEKLFYALGMETFLNFRTIAFRAGINKESINFGFGYYGIKISKFTLGLNYGFGVSTVISDNFGNHKLSIDLQF